MLKLGKHEVKRILKLSELSSDLRTVLKAFLGNKTSCYRDDSKPDWDKFNNPDTVIGLNIYKDYYKYIEVVYPAKSYSDEPYHAVGVCRIAQDINNTWVADLYSEYDHALLEDKEHRHELELEFINLFNNDLSHTIDYQYEMIQEAISNGDFQDLEDLVGDRDLVEFI